MSGDNIVTRLEHGNFSAAYIVDGCTDGHKVLPVRDALNVLYGLAAALVVLGLAVSERDWGLRYPAH